jgi:hypothetical protein
MAAIPGGEATDGSGESTVGIATDVAIPTVEAEPEAENEAGGSAAVVGGSMEALGDSAAGTVRRRIQPCCTRARIRMQRIGTRFMGLFFSG